MPPALAITSLTLRAFRNVDASIEPSPRFNVIAGDNGHGKTNLLEAIYLVLTSKSFRAGRPGEMIQHNEAVASVRVRITEGDLTYEKSVGLRHGGKHVRIDGKRPESLLAYAVRTPVVLFHPGEVALSQGGGTERRKLLDRVSLYLRPEGTADAEGYARALKERQRALETRGEGARDLDAWEALVVRHGLAVMAARDEAARAIGGAAKLAFERIAAKGLGLEVTYRPAAPLHESDYLEALFAGRTRDVHRRSAGTGPHRDDLLLEVGGHKARGTASQGQHRAVVLALKAAEIELIAAARGVRPILLLDDVSSELDRARTAALLGYLQAQEGQVFVTTTRRELMETGDLGSAAERTDYRVSEGRILRL